MTIKDTPEEWEIRATETPFVGNKTSVRTDDVVMPDGKEYVEERHRHRYEVNNAYRAELEKKAGIVFSGTSPDGKLVEYVEYPRDVHPYLVATQAHPELRSRPTRPHPLFAGLVKAAVERKTSK